MHQNLISALERLTEAVTAAVELHTVSPAERQTLEDLLEASARRTRKLEKISRALKHLDALTPPAEKI